MALVDLFDVAARYQGADGVRRRLWKPARERSRNHKDQRAFLDQAIAELAQGGKVVLGAARSLCRDGEREAVDARQPARSRRGRGRRRDVSRRDVQSHRRPTPGTGMHQKAAQAVLKALLPDSGTDIKGRMRSEQELQAAAGTRRPAARLSTTFCTSWTTSFV